MAVKHDLVSKDRYTMPQVEIFNDLLKTWIVEIQGTKVLNVSGEVDAYSSPLFKMAVMRLLDNAEPHLVIDVENVKYMDSSGFSTLFYAVKRLSPSGGTINLVGCNSTMRRMLHLLHLDTIISFHNNVDDAMDAIYVDCKC